MVSGVRLCVCGEGQRKMKEESTNMKKKTKRRPGLRETSSNRSQGGELE